MNVIRYTFQTHGCVHGKLVTIEELKDISFPIRRVYYIYDLKPEDTRGHHAHKTLQQLLIATSGSVDVIMDDGTNKQTFHLNKSWKGLLIPPGLWRDLEIFSGGAVLMCLASEKYDAADYIRDYQEFLAYKSHE